MPVVGVSTIVGGSMRIVTTGPYNTVLTPHIGYVTDGLYELFYTEIVESIAAWCRGEPLRVIEP